jgi:hypothetical protein
MASGLLPMVGLTMWNMQNLYYPEVSETEKKKNWIFMIPGSRKKLMLPKPANVQLMLNPFQMSYETLVGTARETPGSILMDAVQGVSPVEASSILGPPLAKELTQQLVNRDAYWNSDIVKDTESRAPGPWQYNANTSETVKALAQGLKWLPEYAAWFKSPERLQHAIPSLTGGTGYNALWAIDQLMRVNPNHRPIFKLKSVPVLNRLYGETEEMDSSLQREIRDALRKMNDAGRGMSPASNIKTGVKIEQPMTQTQMDARTADAGKQLDTAIRRLKELGEAQAALSKIQDAIEAKNPNVKHHLYKPPTVD